MSTAKTLKSSEDHPGVSFADHIGEFRSRLVWIALTFIVSSAIAYNFRDILVRIVLDPLGDQKLVYLTPAGGFSFIFQITMYVGAVVTAPLIIYHLYQFVRPALPERAAKYSLRIIVIATLLMLLGVTFGYFVAVPSALSFLTAFAGDFIEANLTADSYLGFIVAYVVGLGLMFQLPLLLVFWNWINPMGPGKLLASQKYLIIFAFVAAAIITPTPDILNQALVAGPIIAIYQVGVVAVFFMNRRQARKARRLDAKNKALTSSISPLATPSPTPSQENPTPSLNPGVYASSPEVLPSNAIKSTPNMQRRVLPRAVTPIQTPRRSTIDGMLPVRRC